jgi:polyhydroxyalkanoate synthesis regulator phasin
MLEITMSADARPTPDPAPADRPAPDRSAPADDALGSRLREAWHKTVGTWATDDKSTAGLVSRLVSFGTLSSEEARRVLADARKRTDANKAELDRRVDESLGRAASFFTREQKEMKKLEDRVAHLEERLRALGA